MVTLLVLLVLFAVLPAASALGRTVDSRDARFDLGRLDRRPGASS